MSAYNLGRHFLVLMFFYLMAFNVYSVTCSPAGSVVALSLCISTAASGDVIELGGFVYTLTAVDNSTDGANGLPVITEAITIQNGTIERSLEQFNY